MKRLSESVDRLGVVVHRFAEQPLVHVTLTVAPVAIRLRFNEPIRVDVREAL